MDYERLRKDLKEYYGAAVFSGLPMAVIELSDVESALESKLINIASRTGFNLDDYKEDKWNKYKWGVLKNKNRFYRPIKLKVIFI